MKENRDSDNWTLLLAAGTWEQVRDRFQGAEDQPWIIFVQRGGPKGIPWDVKDLPAETTAVLYNQTLHVYLRTHDWWYRLFQSELGFPPQPWLRRVNDHLSDVTVEQVVVHDHRPTR